MWKPCSPPWSETNNHTHFSNSPHQPSLRCLNHGGPSSVITCRSVRRDSRSASTNAMRFFWGFLSFTTDSSKASISESADNENRKISPKTFTEPFYNRICIKSPLIPYPSHSVFSYWNSSPENHPRNLFQFLTRSKSVHRSKNYYYPLLLMIMFIVLLQRSYSIVVLVEGDDHRVIFEAFSQSELCDSLHGQAQLVGTQWDVLCLWQGLPLPD